jgi:predicted lactoylglutathione lyase
MIWSDTITFQLLARDYFASFTTKPVADAHATCQALLCLSRDSRRDVDALVESAAKAGGKSDVRSPIDMDFLYNRTFEDPDGHVFELVWLNPDAVIARIEALAGTINAVVMRDFDRAREQAKEIDLRVANGADLPLAGVPMTVKECFNIAGLPTTFGLEFARTYRPTEDAPAVRRLKDAGAIILGKTNVAPGLADYQSDNPVYGRTRNPHDPTRSPGGSSSGSGHGPPMGGVIAGRAWSRLVRSPTASRTEFGHCEIVT